MLQFLLDSAEMFSLLKKSKGGWGWGWDQGLWLREGRVRESWWCQGSSEPARDTEGREAGHFLSGVQMLQMHGHRPRFLGQPFQFPRSPRMISGCLGVLS